MKIIINYNLSPNNDKACSKVKVSTYNYNCHDGLITFKGITTRDKNNLLPSKENKHQHKTKDEFMCDLKELISKHSTNKDANKYYFMVADYFYRCLKTF